jgi:hypothetical protein
MPICPQTGISIPECSCSACLQEQVRRNMPALLGIEVRAIRTGGAVTERPGQRQGRAA